MMKFSAVAKQVGRRRTDAVRRCYIIRRTTRTSSLRHLQVVQVIPDKSLESLAPCLVGRNGKPLVRNGMIDSQALESYLSEEELLDEEDEADMSLLPQNVQLLLPAV